MNAPLSLKYDDNGDLLYEKLEPSPVNQLTGEHFSNLAVQMTDDDLDQTATTLTEFVTIDEDGREEWERINAEAWELLGVGPESDPDLIDEDDATDTSDNPLLLTALTRWISKATAAVLPSAEDAVNYGLAFDKDDIPDPNQRREMVQDAHEAGRRVQQFYTDYLYNQLPSYVEDTDQLLMEMGLNGLGVRKIFTDTTRKAPVQACYVPATDIIVSYDAKNFKTGRIAHRMQMSTPDLIRMIQSNQYRAVEGLTDGSVPDKDEVLKQKDRIHGLSQTFMEGTETHKIYEIHSDLFLANDPHPLGLARPYIVTIHARTMEVLSIVRNWRENDPSESRIENFVGYIFHPGKSAVYGMGLGHLLANITRALRTAQRRGMEAAYLQNHPSGFKLSNFKIRDDATKIRSGEFVDVDSPQGDIRASLMLHPFEGPSAGLMSLSQHLESNGKQLGGMATQDLDGLMKAGMAAGPAMAAYEENTEFQSSIHTRLYRSVATELSLIHQRMREIHGSSPVPFGDNQTLRPGDLLKVKVLPKMRPGHVSKAKQVMEAQAVLELSQGEAMGDIINKRDAALNYLRALGVANIDDIMKPDPDENPPKPLDPVSEYGQILMGEPVKAGVSQNHEAHIAAHSAQMSGLQTSNLPIEQGEAAMAAIAAHIAEHYAMDMIQKVAGQTGIPVEQFQEGIPPEVEAQIAPQLAQAVQQVEAARKPPDSEETKITVENIRQNAQKEKETMRQRHEREMAELKHRQNVEIQKQRDDAAMDRSIQDDETAIEIAEMADRNTAPTRAGGISS